MSHPSDIVFELTQEVEKDDGSVTLVFNTNEKAQQTCIELGLKVLLYVAVADMSTEELFEMLESKMKETRVEGD